MKPDPTIVIVFGTLFLSFLFALLYAFWYQQFKHKYKTPKRAAGQDLAPSIRVSELEAVIRKATAEAMLPLAERLSTLEAEVTSLHAVLEQDSKRILSAHKEEPLIELPEDERGEELARSPSRRRVR